MNVVFKQELQRRIYEQQKAQNTTALETYRSIMNAIVTFEKNNPGKEWNHVEIITGLAKQRKQSIDAYVAANDEVRAQQERDELTLLEAFLPKMMTADEITPKIDAIIHKLGTVTKADMGKILNIFKLDNPGQDMKITSDIVKSKLN